MFNTSCCFVFIWGNQQVEELLCFGGPMRGKRREGCHGLFVVAASCHPGSFVPGKLVVIAADAALPPRSSRVTTGSFLQGGLGVFVQLMPILILILVSALSQLMVSSPPYSLSPRP